MLAAAIGVRELPGWRHTRPAIEMDSSVLNYVHTGRKRVAFPTHQAHNLNPVRQFVSDPETASRSPETAVRTLTPRSQCAS